MINTQAIQSEFYGTASDGFVASGFSESLRDRVFEIALSAGADYTNNLPVRQNSDRIGSLRLASDKRFKKELSDVMRKAAAKEKPVGFLNTILFSFLLNAIIKWIVSKIVDQIISDDRN